MGEARPGCFSPCNAGADAVPAQSAIVACLRSPNVTTIAIGACNPHQHYSYSDHSRKYRSLASPQPPSDSSYLRSHPKVFVL